MRAGIREQAGQGTHERRKLCFLFTREVLTEVSIEGCLCRRHISLLDTGNPLAAPASAGDDSLRYWDWNEHTRGIGLLHVKSLRIVCYRLINPTFGTKVGRAYLKREEGSQP
jgi:hypothetical protein